VSRVSRGLDRVVVTFDDPNLVANAGLLLVATLSARLGIGAIVDATVRMAGIVGGARPGRKVLTLVHAIVAGATHIDHADLLRAGGTEGVLGHQVMAPSTLGTFLRAFSFGHVRQLEAVVGKVLERAWSLGAGPGESRLVIDVDSTICQVEGKNKQGAAYGYTKVLGYHPILATRADTGEVVAARMRKGSANTARGARRFIDEIVARARRAGASGQIVMRFDSGFWSGDTLKVLARHDVRYTMAVRANTKGIAEAIAGIDNSAWTDIEYTPDGVAQVAETQYGGRRLIVRRTRLTDRRQARLWPDWRNFAFLTCATRRHQPGGMKGPTFGLSQQPAEAESSPTPEARGRAESSSDNDGTVWHHQTGRVRQARRKGVRVQEPVVEPPQERNRLEPGGFGPGSSARPPWGGRLPPSDVRVDEEATAKACGVTVARLQGKSWAPTPSNG